MIGKNSKIIKVSFGKQKFLGIWKVRNHSSSQSLNHFFQLPMFDCIN